MKHRIQRALVVAVVAFGLSACGGGDSGSSVDVGANGSTSLNAARLAAALAVLPVETPLSGAESASLTFMREEEKLAHDVYAVLDGQWAGATQTFGNIAASESTHTEAVRELLVRYGLSDPALNQPIGSFTDATLQALYTTLVNAGASDLGAALRVGAQIEELDIRDIEAALLTIDNQDIAMVYDSLLQGSRNHMRAFNKALTAQGTSYTPQYISQAEYDAIVGSPMER